MVKKIFNLHEEVTNRRLKEVCASLGAHVYPKIRVADVLNIEGSGISDEQFRFALKAHFDFVVCDEEQTPQFAVEFDGPSHTDKAQRKRDALKDHLCEQLNFPILRINSNHLIKKYKSYSLLGWFVEHWFLRKAFDEAQEKGLIPWDEPYDPMMIFSMGNKIKWPMWLSSDLRIKIKKLHDHGKIQDWIIPHWIGVDQRGNYHGLSWIKINSSEAVMVETGMRKQRFPVSESDLLIEVLAFLIFDRLEVVLSGKESALPIGEVKMALHNAAAKYECRGFAGFSNDKPIRVPKPQK
jgi:hypothetical protein